VDVLGDGLPPGALAHGLAALAPVSDRLGSTAGSESLQRGEQMRCGLSGSEVGRDRRLREASLASDVAKM